MHINGYNESVLHYDCQARGRRKATLALELLFVLPVLMAMLLGMVEFSLFLSARQQLTNAAREGARVAALGGDGDEVRQSVRQFLGTGTLSQAEIDVRMTGEDGQPVKAGDPVAVVVNMPVGRAVPDLLAFIGLSLRDQTMAAGAVMRKE